VAKTRKYGSAQDMEAMQKEVVHLFDQCDRIVAFNGINFDFPFIVKWLGAHYDHAPADTNTEEHAGTTEEHENESCTDFVNTMQTIHELDSSGTRRVAGINNTSRHMVWPSKYVDFCLMSLEYTNKYISLKNLCGMNCVKAVKSGTGLDAIGFAEREQWPELEHYCQQDVRVLLELTQRAVSHGLKYPCHGYTSCEDLVHVIFDVAMTSSVKSADMHAGPEMSIFQAFPKKFQQACPQKRPRMP